MPSIFFMELTGFNFVPTSFLLKCLDYRTFKLKTFQNRQAAQSIGKIPTVKRLGLNSIVWSRDSQSEGKFVNNTRKKN